MEPPPDAARRPIAARGAAPVHALLRLLLRTRLTPDAVSFCSMVFAAIGALALAWGARQPASLLLAVIGAQGRLLCNLLDGMLAVEGGRGGPLGALWNEVPDRVSDTLLLVALGWAAGSPSLGWAMALAAALTAYVRLLGASLGQAQSFGGPMAKQHRMAVLCLGCLGAVAEVLLGWAPWALLLASWVIVLGSALTVASRLRGVARRMAP